MCPTGRPPRGWAAPGAAAPRPPHLGCRANPKVVAPGAGEDSGLSAPNEVEYLVRGGLRSGRRASTLEKGEGAGGACGAAGAAGGGGLGAGGGRPRPARSPAAPPPPPGPPPHLAQPLHAAALLRRALPAGARPLRHRARSRGGCRPPAMSGAARVPGRSGAGARGAPPRRCQCRRPDRAGGRPGAVPGVRGRGVRGRGDRRRCAWASGRAAILSGGPTPGLNTLGGATRCGGAHAPPPPNWGAHSGQRGCLGPADRGAAVRGAPPVAAAALSGGRASFEGRTLARRQ